MTRYTRSSFGVCFAPAPPVQLLPLSCIFWLVCSLCRALEALRRPSGLRPGRVKREFDIDLPRPRVMEDVSVARAARDILNELREEINRSLEAEYSVGVKPRIEPGVSA